MWNQAFKDIRRYHEIYNAAKTGFIGSAGDGAKLESFLAEVYVDLDRKTAFLDCVADGTEADGEPEDLIEEKSEPLIDLKNEVYTRYPPPEEP